MTPAELNELERAAKAAATRLWDAQCALGAMGADVVALIAYARRLEALLPEVWDAGCDLQERERSRWIADALARAREGSK